MEETFNKNFLYEPVKNVQYIVAIQQTLILRIIFLLNHAIVQRYNNYCLYLIMNFF